MPRGRSGTRYPSRTRESSTKRRLDPLVLLQLQITHLHVERQHLAIYQHILRHLEDTKKTVADCVGKLRQGSFLTYDVEFYER